MRARIESPSKFYIKFVLSDEQLGFREACVRLLTEGIDVLEDVSREANDPLRFGYLRSIEADLDFPPDYQPTNLDHGPTYSWLKEQRILDMWAITPAVQDAMSIRNNAYLLEALNPLLLSTIPLSFIAKRLQGRAHLRLTVANLQVYQHFYWNRQIMGQDEWSWYLQGKGHLLYAGLTSPADLAEKHLPHVLSLSGPPTWHGADAVRRVMQNAYNKLLQIEHRPPSTADAQMMKSYMDVLFKGDEMLQRSGNAIEEAIRTFQKFRIRKEELPVVDLDKLSGGNYSGSGTGSGDKERALSGGSDGRKLLG